LYQRRTNTVFRFAGVYSSGATPVPIPNTEVKPACGDGIAGLTLWESSTMPAFYFDPVEKSIGFFIFLKVNNFCFIEIARLGLVVNAER
jgi:hypothetical protein